MPHPSELSRPLWMRISCPGHNLLFQQERRWQFPLIENDRALLLKWRLLGSVGTGVYSMHAKLINQCLKSILTENIYYL